MSKWGVNSAKLVLARRRVGHPEKTPTEWHSTRWKGNVRQSQWGNVTVTSQSRARVELSLRRTWCNLCTTCTCMFMYAHDFWYMNNERVWYLHATNTHVYSNTGCNTRTGKREQRKRTRGTSYIRKLDTKPVIQVCGEVSKNLTKHYARLCNTIIAESQQTTYSLIPRPNDVSIIA